MRKTLDLAILPPRERKRLEQRPVLYIDYRPEPTQCPYCDRPFDVIVGCHKVCQCGYSEGCED